MEQLQKYYAQDLRKVWTYDSYKIYDTAKWDWVRLPFDDDFSRKSREALAFCITKPVTGKSILEVGSAMGGAYNHMKSTGLVDLAQYTGVEISEMGYNRAREKFPEANWINSDFTRFELPQQYDYSFERIAVHHMPDPVRQMRKMMDHTRIAMVTSFVGCLRGPTVSDLNLGYYNNEGSGLAYFDIINVFEVVRAGLEAGFNHIKVIFWSLHYPIPTDPAGHQYLAPEIQAQNKIIGFFTVRVARCPELPRPMVYGVPSHKGLAVRKPHIFAEFLWKLSQAR